MMVRCPIPPPPPPRRDKEERYKIRVSRAGVEVELHAESLMFAAAVIDLVKIGSQVTITDKRDGKVKFSDVVMD
ncbi:hypothetical protein BcepF1.050 [Burkholderia phage BcepF1]|uniref:Uncharacterized protein n=1 Tax=Burkholderia phage BcepF1 TaxID=2886897 RepID=A1YZV4_9CAUD|nr:hypothetical protein BcepF1.050 [Burkholderia phage BcepF1]ABL96781.1 hypothetical protein BcepF1.050 [Burkholderia phage BcepF1]